MRLAINAAFLDGSFNGLSVYAQSIIDALTQSNNEIHVYTSEPARLNVNGQTKLRRTPKSIRAERGTIGNALRALVWSQTALPARLLRDRIQVFLSPVSEGMLVPVCPQVVVVHDLFPFFFPDLYPRWKYYYQRVLPHVLKVSRRVIVVSKHTRQDLVRQLGVPEDKIEVVYNWVNPLYLSDAPGAPPEHFKDEPYFLFVGRCTAYKNLEMVLRALAAIRSTVGHALVCVLGITSALDREHLSKMLDLAVSLGIRDRLRIYTGVPPAQLLYIYRHATALVLLSKYEGFGYPPLEAMAVGTPAIVSDSTALSEVAGSAAVCVPNAEPYAAAEAMKRLACDTAFRAKMSARGKARARQFSAERSIGLISSIVESCASSG